MLVAGHGEWLTGVRGVPHRGVGQGDGSLTDVTGAHMSWDGKWWWCTGRCGVLFTSWLWARTLRGSPPSKGKDLWDDMLNNMLRVVSLHLHLVHLAYFISFRVSSVVWWGGWESPTELVAHPTLLNSFQVLAGSKVESWSWASLLRLCTGRICVSYFVPWCNKCFVIQATTCWLVTWLRAYDAQILFVFAICFIG